MRVHMTFVTTVGLPLASVTPHQSKIPDTGITQTDPILPDIASLKQPCKLTECKLLRTASGSPGPTCGPSGITVWHTASRRQNISTVGASVACRGRQEAKLIRHASEPLQCSTA
jgi:hypothetical protein